jgi:transcriptional regulator with GAF, ATPase, and Fis domain
VSPMRHEALRPADLVDSYRRLTAIYHDLLSHDELEQLLQRIADSIEELVPCDALLVAELDPPTEILVPILARGAWSDLILQLRPRVGEGLIGWAAAHATPVLANDATSDPRAAQIAGTSEGDEEAIISIPLAEVSGRADLEGLLVEADAQTYRTKRGRAGTASTVPRAQARSSQEGR